MKDDNCQLCETLDESWERERETWNCDETRRCSVVFSMTRQKVTSYFDKSRGSLLITGAHCDIQPSGIQGFNIIDTQQRGQHPRLLKESLSIECRTLLLYPFLKHSKLGEVPTVFRKRWPSLGMKNFLSPINGITVNGITAPVWRKYYIWREKGNIFFFFWGNLIIQTRTWRKNLREIFGRIKIRLMRLRRFSRKPQVVEVNTFLPYVNFD